jgi:hypothetical protein
MRKPYSLYYHAITDRKRTWFVSGIIRNEKDICLERCLDKTKSLFEFFVPTEMEPHFLEVMNFLMEGGYILSLEKLPNRLNTNL